MQSGKIEFANTCRGIAALSVVIVHLCISFWVHQSAVSAFTGLPVLSFATPAFATALSAVPVNFAAFGVALFFVVSGFVIPISLERYDARAFLLARFVRIWPTYWAGFSVTVAALAIGVAFYGGERTFTTAQAIIHYFPPLRPLLYSKPLDGIVWTLEIEFFWYLLAASLAGPLRHGSLRIFLAPLGLSILFGLSWAFTSHPPPGFAKLAGRFEFITIYSPLLSFLFCGVALDFRQRSLVTRRTCAALLAICLVPLGAAASTGVLDGIVDPRSYGVALGVFTLAMWAQDRLPGGRLLRFLARVSYPLYVIHGFAGYVLLHVLTVAGWPPVLALTATICVAVALAACLHYAVEAPSHRLAQRLSRAWSQRFATAPDATSR